MNEDDRVIVKSPALWADAELEAFQQVRVIGVGLVNGKDVRLGNNGKTWTKFTILLDGLEVEVLQQPPEPVEARVTVPPE
jgi:hypothetical protein